MRASCRSLAVAQSQASARAQGASASVFLGSRHTRPRVGGGVVPSPNRHHAALRRSAPGSARARPYGVQGAPGVCQGRRVQLLRCSAVADRGEAEADVGPLASGADARLTSAAEPPSATRPDRPHVSIFGTTVSFATLAASAVLLSGVLAVVSSGRTRAPSPTAVLQPPPLVSSPVPSPTQPHESPALPSPVTLGTRLGKTTTQEARSAITATFPKAVEASAFLDSVAAQLAGHGIKRGNCIALVSTCRDEASRILDAGISERFGLIFNLHGLAGVPPGGVLAVQAGCMHSPVGADGRERYVFIALSHIGIDERGAVGSIRRVGQGVPSGACGALLFVTAELEADRRSNSEFPPSPDTAELHFLRQGIEARGPSPDLVAVTEAAVDVINEAVEGVIAQAVDPTKADYAVITGIQIHSGANVYDAPFSYESAAEFVVPSAGYVVIDGERKPLTF